MQVHRFGDKVAIYLNTGETQYLEVDTAIELADAITAVVDDIEIHSFSESECGTFTPT